MSYDAIEPINPAGVILKGLTQNKDQPSPPPKQENWMNQKMQMLKYISIFGKKK